MNDMKNLNIKAKEINPLLIRSISYRKKRQLTVGIILVILLILLAASVLLLGNTIYPPRDILRVLAGEEVKGASFAVTNVRLPRLLTGLISGIAFGVGGITFQTLLRNPLASPDIIGISSGSGVAAAVCLLVLGTNRTTASMAAIAGGLLVALVIYGLSGFRGFSIEKLILIGLGVQAMMRAVISFLLLKAATYDVPVALRWLSGSLNGTKLSQVPGLLITTAVLTAVILLLSRNLRALELGEQTAVSLGSAVGRVRMVLIISAVFMIAVATSVTGPIACVTFLAGPIATRLVGERSASIFHAGLVGAILVLAADIVGQFMLDTRFPVGVITGILGAPYLIYLLISMNKRGTL